MVLLRNNCVLKKLNHFACRCYSKLPLPFPGFHCTATGWSLNNTHRVLFVAYLMLIKLSQVNLLLFVIYPSWHMTTQWHWRFEMTNLKLFMYLFFNTVRVSISKQQYLNWLSCVHIILSLGVTTLLYLWPRHAFIYRVSVYVHTYVYPSIFKCFLLFMQWSL